MPSFTLTMKMPHGLALVSLAVFVVAGISIFANTHREARVAACRNHLTQIAGAKGSHGLENRLARGARVAPTDLSPYLKDGWKGLRCPAGGLYEPGLFTGDKETGDVHAAPTCTVHGSLAALEASADRHWLLPQEREALALGCFLLAAGVGFLHLRDRKRPAGENRP